MRRTLVATAVIFACVAESATHTIAMQAGSARPVLPTQEEATPASVPDWPLPWPLPETGKAYADIDGKRLWQYVQEQAGISRRYRDQGHPQFWGRITGTSSDLESADWLVEKYRQIGLTDIRKQTLALQGAQWAPKSWHVTVTTGEQTLELKSAQPAYGVASTDGKVLDLPVVYVGLGTEADFAGRDVSGKAVLVVRGEIYYHIAPEDVLQRALERGAAAIFGTDLRGGNYKALAYRHPTATVPLFNVGTEDAQTVIDMISKAPAGAAPHLKIRLDADWVSGQKSYLVWGTLPGATDETIYVVAHRDGWFDGAGDNASGVAAMLGVAEHFSKIPRQNRRRTMVFIGLDGHHNNPSGYGRDWLYANRDRLFAKTALIINSEHPSQMLIHHGGIGHPGDIKGHTEQIIPMWWYAGGRSRPELTKIAHDAFREFGVPLWREERRITGDMNPFWRSVPGVVVQSSYFMHMHTDGDSPEIVSWAGLQSAARAFSRIIDEVNKLPLEALQRPPEEDWPLRTDACPEWIRDSSVFCKQ